MYGKRWCGSQVLCLSKPPIEKEGMVENPGIKEEDRKKKGGVGREGGELAVLQRTKQQSNLPDEKHLSHP